MGLPSVVELKKRARRRYKAQLAGESEELDRREAEDYVRPLAGSSFPSCFVPKFVIDITRRWNLRGPGIGAGHGGAIYNWRMPISARNKLKGTVEEVVLGTVMAHVVVRVGDNVIESAITRRSADELHLKKGDTVTAIIKSTEVMIQKD